MIWHDVDRQRHFLILEEPLIAQGETTIVSLTGARRLVDKTALIPFEVTEDQARRWAKDQLGQTLDELKQGIAERLAELRQRLEERNRTPVNDKTTLTPNAAPALLELLRGLPGVIANSLARDASRLDSAKTTMADLQRRLKDAGIDLDDRFTAFPARLAEMREDVHKQSAINKPPSRTPPADKT
ncbi:hypothetical protein LJR267_010708 [Paraburkholderia hospita]|uniref:hypothetical protein n=1 Tax=Paraburkholderia hospita TaxID=169430 RepID=UPI003ECC6F3F